MTCIFVDQPKECSLCMESRKIHCLLNHTHLKVSTTGAKELHQLLEAEISTTRRVKEKSGQAGRLI